MGTQEKLGNRGLIAEKRTNVDIVFVIDASASMQEMINAVKDTARTFHERLTDELATVQRKITSLRVRVIGFRDFYCDGDYALEQSDFFELPEESDDFYNFLDKLEAKGGGDDPESALEALTLAIRSDFTPREVGQTCRHIIILFTDQAAHPFESYDELVAKELAEGGSVPTCYPADMPKTLGELFSIWETNVSGQEKLGTYAGNSKMDAKTKKLILFAPDAYPWNEMEDELTNCTREPLELGESGTDLNMDVVMAQLKNSV